ncbi:MAG TPA: hypothetical protein VJ994_10925 [Paracoccaceae bacterium]|nr:hypothetical protein [Paracoccaceae bacterium]
MLFSTTEEREAVEIVAAFAELRAEAETLAEDGGLTLRALRMGAEGEALRVLWRLEGPGAEAFAPEDRTGEFRIA